MRMRAAHEGGMQHVRHHDVVDEAPLAAQERRILDAATRAPIREAIVSYLAIAWLACWSTSLGVAYSSARSLSMSAPLTGLTSIRDFAASAR